MKMSKENYNEIEKEIKKLIVVNGKEKIKQHRQTVKFSKCQWTAFLWSMYYMLPMNIKDVVRKENLDNSHVQTALNKILINFN